ncbi:MAG: substrate-binding domain-containing protein [Lachnospiraceae bacterium]|nr:substrate-binding domain-containing protein [Lachnospiraceae bacterium]
MDKRRNLTLKLIIAFIVLMALVTVGSFISMRRLTTNLSSTSKAGTGIKYTGHYAFIHTGSDEDLWDSIYEGARIKGEELGIYVEDFGAGLTVDYDRNELIAIAAGAEVDGIIVEGDTDEEESAAINKAIEAGIPVVTVFNDCAESSRVSFVGFSNYNIGRQYGEQLLKTINTEEPVRISVLMDNEQASGNSNLVISGITDVFTEKGVLDGYEIEGVYVNNESAFTAEEDIRDIFLNGDLPDVMVAMNSVYTRCLFQAVVDYNKMGDVSIYGFDDSEDILEAVSKGLIEGTVSVDPTRMGASAVSALDEYISTGYVSDYITQDTEVILIGDAKAKLETDVEETE